MLAKKPLLQHGTLRGHGLLPQKPTSRKPRRSACYTCR